METSKMYAVLLLLITFVAGFFVGSITQNFSKQTQQPAVEGQDLVQQILQDSGLTDPQQRFAGYTTGMLYTHSISGRVVKINQSIILLRVNESTITIPRAYPTASFFVVYFQVANNTRTITSWKAISVGDRITLARHTNAVTYKNVGMAITIHKQNIDRKNRT